MLATAPHIDWDAELIDEVEVRRKLRWLERHQQVSDEEIVEEAELLLQTLDKYGGTSYAS
jgi:hypothetical protein